jgi:Copper amine oxidase N-terminal domain/Bacterial Ig domain
MTTAVSAQTVTVGGQPLNLSPGPIERAGRIFVPLRGIFERLGATVVYQTGTINATKGATTVSLHIGSTQATVNGQPQILDVAPFIVGATTYVPLRFVSQSLGASVDWNPQTQVVAINLARMVEVRPPARPYPPPPPPAGRLELRAQQPAPGAAVTDRFIVISARFTTEADANSVRVLLDGNDITSRGGVSRTGFSYRPPAPLNFGSHNVRVAGTDRAGVRFDRVWSFTVVNNGPPSSPIQLRAQQPAPGASVSNRFIVISARFTAEVNGDSVRVRLDGNDITSRSGASGTGFSYTPPAPLDFGSHTVRVTGRGLGGLTFDRSWSFSVIRSGPKMSLTIDRPGDNDVVGAAFVVAGSTAANARVRVTAGAGTAGTGLFDDNTTAGPRGNFRMSVSFKRLMGQQAVRVRVTATDPQSSEQREQTLQLRLNP